jgi:hypothetical protein
MLNLDTHILIFALTGDLKPREKDALSRDSWSISAIVLWELSSLARLGRIEYDFDDPDLSTVEPDSALANRLGRMPEAAGTRFPQRSGRRDHCGNQPRPSLTADDQRPQNKAFEAPTVRLLRFPLRQQFLDYLAADIRQPEVSALEFERQLGVVET